VERTVLRASTEFPPATRGTAGVAELAAAATEMVVETSGAEPSAGSASTSVFASRTTVLRAET